jgi:pyruvate formate lyase activating enzyme
MPTPDELPRCAVCGASGIEISRRLGVCRSCILDRSESARVHVDRLRRRTRVRFMLPVRPPRHGDGVACGQCVHACQPGIGERGFCGLRQGQQQRGRRRLAQLAGTTARGLLDWYRDPLPTNCCSDWVCAGHEQHGLHNLAVSYRSCTLDCLFCQNWHFRRADPEGEPVTDADGLAAAARDDTFCVCFFGGDPASQMSHALAAGRRLAARGVTVCWETAGTQSQPLMDQALQLSLDSGGTVKFDLKAWDERLHRALTGGSNRNTLSNFERATRRAAERPRWPLVVAATLLVPGYVTPDEVALIARFIAKLDPDTPYTLQAFGPKFALDDLPTTSSRHAEQAVAAALDAGLTNVHVGNRFLLR